MIIAALAPVFAIILVGWGIHRFRLIADGFWQPAESITFNLLFPSLLVIETSAARLQGSGVAPMLVAVLAGILLITALTFTLRGPLTLDGPAFTSLIQGAIRPNVYVGLGAAHALFGGDGVALVAVCLAFGVPLVNIVGVLALVRWGSPADTRLNPRAIVVPLLSNPLILACLLGLALNASGLGIIGPLRAVLDILGRASLPIGLLAVGAGLARPTVGSFPGAAVCVAAGLKLLLLPTITLALCLVLGVGGEARAAAVLYAALPCSASAYVMARQMGGDAPLLAAVIIVTTIAAAATLPLAIALAR